MYVNKMDYFKNKLQDNRPLLGSNSITTYVGSLKRIQKECPNIRLESIGDFIKHHKEIVAKLDESLTPIVRKSKISAIVSLIDDTNNKNHPKELVEALQYYRNSMKKDMAVVKERYLSQELTEKQQANMMTQEEVMKIYNQIKAQALPLFKLSKLNRAQFNLMQSYVLLSCYVLIPPRRSQDYSDFKIRNIDENVDNYMTNFNKNKKKGLSSFVFNSYKNSKRLGRQVMNDIPKSLEKIINQWMEFNKSDYLLVNLKGEKVDHSRMNQWFNNIFEKNIGTSMLRHIYATNLLGDVDLSKLKAISESMSHTDIETTLQYAMKNKDAVEEKEI
jgi:integrase